MQFDKSKIILKLNLDTFYIKSVSPIQQLFGKFNIFQIIYFVIFIILFDKNPTSNLINLTKKQICKI